MREQIYICVLKGNRMTEAISNNMSNQQQKMNGLQPVSYNAVQINMKTPTVNVDQQPQPPLPPTATQQWQA